MISSIMIKVRFSLLLSVSEKNIFVDFTGSAFGLSLILNIERYEYMPGSDNDIGVKVRNIADRFREQFRDMGHGNTTSLKIC